MRSRRGTLPAAPASRLRRGTPAPRPLLRALPRRGPPPPKARPACAGGGDGRKTGEEERLCRLQVGPTRQEATSASSVAKPLSKTAPEG